MTYTIQVVSHERSDIFNTDDIEGEKFSGSKMHTLVFLFMWPAIEAICDIITSFSTAYRISIARQ